MKSLIEAIAKKWGDQIFVSGQCHTLAMALLMESSYGIPNGQRTGVLFACIRKSIKDDGACFSTRYSHMVYECPSRDTWDIDGDEADVRWEEQFDLETTDKWGMVTELEWVRVPQEDPDLLDTIAWVQEKFGTVDMDLLSQVREFIREYTNEKMMKPAPSRRLKM